MYLSKAEFLKECLKENPNKAFRETSEMLNDFWKGLPKRTKTAHREALFDCIIDTMENILAEAIDVLCDCPYVKIEISNQEDLSKVKNDVSLLKLQFSKLEGYINGLSTNLTNMKNKIYLLKECKDDIFRKRI